MEQRNHIDPLATLALSGLEPLATGKERLVFVHPSAPGLVVKVVRPDRFVARPQDEPTWFRRRRQLRHYTLYLREIREYLALRARAPDAELPIARTVAIVETNFGLGLVSELIRGADGGIARTLAQLKNTGTPRDALCRAVDRLAADLLRLDVVVNDLNPTNIVSGVSTDGSQRLVLVDGYGDKNLVRFRSMSRTFNHYNTRKRVARLLALLEKAQDAPDHTAPR